MAGLAGSIGQSMRCGIVQFFLCISAVASLGQGAESMLSGRVLGPDSRSLAKVCVTVIQLATEHERRLLRTWTGVLLSVPCALETTALRWAAAGGCKR